MHTHLGRTCWLAVATTVFVAQSANGVTTAGAQPSVAAISLASTQVAGGPFVIPQTVPGKRLRDVLDLAGTSPIAAETYERLFSADFRDKIPLAQFAQVLSGALGPSARVQQLLSSGRTSLSVVVRGAGGLVQVDLATDTADRISGLFLSPYSQQPPPTVPTSWLAIDQRLRKLAPTVAMVGADVSPTGKCTAVHGISADKAAPLGSAFKLYVLAGAADAVARRSLNWDTTIAIRDDWKSLPSGIMQNDPAGTRHTASELADSMMSISDNTATDHLMRTLGREKVESTMVAAGMADPSRNLPFLTTREMFLLKGSSSPELRKKYQSLDATRRRAMLSGVLAKTSLSTVRAWSVPRDIDTIEWFASPMDICRAYAYLSRLADPTSVAAVDQALSINDGGLKLDPTVWPSVWFKGGSEPGVLTLTYMARRPGGGGAVVAVMVSNPSRDFDQQAAARELLAVINGAFSLLRS